MNHNKLHFLTRWGKKNGSKEFLVFAIAVVVGLLGGTALSSLTLLKILAWLLGLAAIGFCAWLIHSEPTEKKPEALFPPHVQHILNIIDIGIVLHDEYFTVLLINKKFEELVQLKKEDLLGKEIAPEMVRNPRFRLITQLFFPSLTGVKITRRSHSAQGAGEFPFETIDVWFSSPKEMVLEISMAEFQDPRTGRRLYVKVVRDRTHETILASREADFLAAAAHQLHTPTNQIRWLLESTLMEKLPAEAAASVQEALRIVKATIMVSDMLLKAIARGFADFTVQAEPNNLLQLIGEIADEFQTKIHEKGLTIKIEKPAEQIPLFPFDRRVVSVILFALIDNAIKYNRRGGVVTVGARKITGRPYAEISITDTGFGIPKEEQPLIFQRFYRGSNVKQLGEEGFGVGLYTVKKFVEIHGGTIAFTSQEGKETTFVFTLPMDDKLIPKPSE